MLARWKNGFRVRRTDGDKGELPSESEPYSTCSDQSYDCHDDAKGSSDRDPSNGASHKPPQRNTGKPTDLLRIFTQPSCHCPSLYKRVSFSGA